MEKLEYREPLDSDQENADKAFKLLSELVNSHREFENNIWAAAFWSALAKSHFDSGYSYKRFCSEVDNVKKHYKYLWEK